jgi:flagellar hook-associated protein 2
MGMMTLLDSITAYQLTSRGLPAPLQKSDAGVPQPDANYSGGVSASTLTSLSGLGQLMAATSTLHDQLADSAPDQTASSSSTTTATVSNGTPAVATASVTDSSQTTSGTYALAVSQLAAPQVQASIYLASSTTDYLGAGSLQVQTAQGTTTVTTNSGSLTDLVSAFNSAGAGVTATLESDAVAGYRLRLTSDQTGTSGGFTVVAPSGDPFNSLANHFSQLGLATIQSPTNASYTVNGGAAISSQSNSGLQLAPGIGLGLLSTGTSTIAVTASTTTTTTAATSYANVLQTANALVSQYNAFQSTVNQLLGVSGSLNGSTVASNIQNSFSAIASNASALSLGFGAGGTANTIQLNAATLSTAYQSSATSTVNNLNALVDSLRTLAQNTLNAAGAGSINGAANTITSSVRSNIATTLSAASSPVPGWVTDVLTNHAVTSVSGTVPFAGFSTYV